MAPAGRFFGRAHGPALGERNVLVNQVDQHLGMVAHLGGKRIDLSQLGTARVVQEPQWAGWLNKPGGVFLLRSERMAEIDRHCPLAALAARELIDLTAFLAVERLEDRPRAALRLGSALGDCRPATDALAPRALLEVLRP